MAEPPAGDPGRPVHWREYLIEALCLALFMVSAGLVTTAVEAPGSPVRQQLADPLLRRALIGAAMGLTAVALIYSPWGRRSGAHMNPAVTLSFLRLGSITRADAAAYAIAQCIGGYIGVEFVERLLGPAFSASPVEWIVTVPGPAGPGAAFVAEAVMSAVLMWTILQFAARRNLAPLTGLAAGLCVALFVTFESPWSGMSINPARTLASAVPAGVYRSLWVYLFAPPLGMLLGAEIHHRSRLAGPCAKLAHLDRDDCIHCGQRGALAGTAEQSREVSS